MKQRLISLMLAFTLLLALFPVLGVSAYDTRVDVEKIVNATVEFFTNHEGNYGDVHCNDSGALSIGKLQWHAQRALRLLKRIVNKNPANAQAILGTALYNEVVNTPDTGWGSRSVTTAEARVISQLLVTPEGVSTQDEQAYEDISGYIDRGYKLGIRTDAALMYYCDIENQYGVGNASVVIKRAKETAGVSGFNSLDQLHTALKNNTTSLIQNYFHRRTTTYNYIKYTLGWNTGVYVPDCPGCPGELFCDMPAKTNWAHEAVEFVLENHLFYGLSENVFGTNKPMTRAMVVTVLYRMEGSPAVSGACPFTDVNAGSWYGKAVIWAEAIGIVSGVGNGKFDPDGNVSREQLATFLYNYARYEGLDVEEVCDLDATFPDTDQLHSYAVTPMAWANAHGLISGESNKGVLTLNPRGEATRAQVAAILMRYITGIGA